MINLFSLPSLTDFQCNARSFIKGLNDTKEEEAVLLNPSTFQELEAKVEQERFITALQDGKRAIQDDQFSPPAKRSRNAGPNL